MERYFIYDALGNKQGNPKGYKTHKAAQTQVDNRLYCLLEGIGLGVHLARTGMKENTHGESYLVSKILLEKVDSPDDLVTIVRVETADGWGMYNKLWFDCGLPCDDNHPTVIGDSLYQKNLSKDYPGCTWEPCGHRFGFADLTMLRRWIYNDSWIRALSDKGATLCTYQLPKSALIVGRTQVTFNYEKAERLSSVPLASIL